MKNLFTNYFAGLIAVLAILVFVGGVNAQGRARGRVYTKGQVGKIINRVDKSTDNFSRNYDKSLDRSHLDGTNREDELNRRAKDLRDSAKKLRNNFFNRSSWEESREDVTNCLSIAADLNANVRNNHYGRKTENNWRNVVRELNTLAQVYNIPQLGSGAYR